MYSWLGSAGGVCLCQGEGATTGVEKDLFAFHVDGRVMLFEDIKA